MEMPHVAGELPVPVPGAPEGTRFAEGHLLPERTLPRLPVSGGLPGGDVRAPLPHVLGEGFDHLGVSAPAADLRTAVPGLALDTPWAGRTRRTGACPRSAGNPVPRSTPRCCGRCRVPRSSPARARNRTGSHPQPGGGERALAERTRRDALRALAVTAGALALAPAVTASRCGRTEDLAAGPHATRGGGGGAPADDPTAPDSSAGRPAARRGRPDSGAGSPRRTGAAGSRAPGPRRAGPPGTGPAATRAEGTRGPGAGTSPWTAVRCT